MNFIGRSGTISVTRRDNYELSFEWRIKGFFSWAAIRAGSLCSPDFIYSWTHWSISMFPYGPPPFKSEDVILLIRGPDVYPPVTIQFTIAIVGAEGEVKRTVIKHEFSSNSPSIKFGFLPTRELKDRAFLLVPNDTLTISCRMKRVLPTPTRGISYHHGTSVEREDQLEESSTRFSGSQSLGKQVASTQTDELLKEDEALSEKSHSLQKQGIEKVLEDIGKLLVSGQKSDITVEVKEAEFRVHSNIICARSPVLSAMLEHDTAERASNKIRIDDCKPDVFQQYLQYLYTGSVQSLSAQTVFDLFTVADKYLADDLKLLCLEYIQNALSVETFCDAVKLALMHRQDDLLQLALDFASKNIQSILISLEWQSFISEYPREANEILIKSLGPKT